MTVPSNHMRWSHHFALLLRRLATAGGASVTIVAIVRPTKPALCWWGGQRVEQQSPRPHQNQQQSYPVLEYDQVEQIVSILIAIVRLDGFSETEEQDIFRHSVRSVLLAAERLLPQAYLKLCRGEHPHGGLTAEDASRLCERLDKATESLSLPYLDAAHERQVIHCVLELLVGSMRANSSFERMMQIEQSSPIMLRHFVKGSAGELVTRRDHIADQLADDITIPLLPVPNSWKLWFCSRVVSAVAEQLENAILESYQTSLDHVNVSVDAEHSLARAKRASRAAAHAVAVAAESSEALLRQRAELFKVGFRYSHGARGVGTVAEVARDGVRVVRFDNGEVHRYRPTSQHKLQPDYCHAATAAAHGDRHAEEAALAAHNRSEAFKARALEEEASAAKAAREARALEEEFARAVSIPFASRARAHLLSSLLARAPRLLPPAATERAVQFAIERALTSTFHSEHMSQAVDYMLDQHRLARRLRCVPPGARQLLLQRKEIIYSTLLAMDDDGSGEISEAELLAAAAASRLGVKLTDADAKQVFLALDDGSGVLRPEHLESLLFGVRLSAEHRASLHAAAELRRKQWHGKKVDDYQVAEADHAAGDFSHHEETKREKGRAASMAALMPLAVFLGLGNLAQASAASISQRTTKATTGTTSAGTPDEPPATESERRQPGSS